MTIDHEGPDPLYLQVADDIAAKIESGELPPGRQILGDERMAQEYGVGRGTAKHAIRVLKERGLVRGVNGRGTFVIRPGERAEDPQS